MYMYVYIWIVTSISLNIFFDSFLDIGINHDVLLVGVAGGGTPLSTREPPTTANNM